MLKFSLIFFSTLSFAGSKYLTEPQYFTYNNPVFAPSIASTWRTSSLANQHGLEIAVALELLDSRRPVDFMKCDDVNVKRNACPANMMGGLFVIEFDQRTRDWEIYDTFWGSQDQSTQPSAEEVKARTNEIIDNIGYTAFVLSGSAKDFITQDEFIQKLRVKTATAFYYHYLMNTQSMVSYEEIYNKVREAASVNHMDVDRYVNFDEVTRLVNQLRKQ